MSFLQGIQECQNKVNREMIDGKYRAVTIRDLRSDHTGLTQCPNVAERRSAYYDDTFAYSHSTSTLHSRTRELKWGILSCTTLGNGNG